MKTPQWPGFDKRLVESIRAAGYPNVGQFADAKGYRITYVYKWARGITPDPQTLVRLAADLGVTAGWLLTGDEVNKVPANPRKRGGRKLVGLVAATLGVWLGLSAPTAWGSGGLVNQNAPAGSLLSTDNVRGIMSRSRRRIYHLLWGSPAPSTSGSLVLTAGRA